MFTVLGFLMAGVVAGYVLRRWKLQFIHAIILTLIWLLLFLLGLEIGSDKNIVIHFAKFGLQAFLLATGGTLGSIIFAKILWKNES